MKVQKGQRKMDYNQIKNQIEKEVKKRYINDIEEIKKTVDRHYKIFIAYHVITFIALVALEFLCLNQKKYIICFFLIVFKITIDQIIKRIYDYVNDDYQENGAKMLILKTNLLKYKFDVIKELYPSIDIKTLKKIIDQDMINVCYIVLHGEMISLSSIHDDTDVIGKINNIEIDCSLNNQNIIINYIKIFLA